MCTHLTNAHVPYKHCTFPLLYAYYLWTFLLAIYGHPLLMSEMCSRCSASSALGEPQNHNFHVSRSLNQCSAKPTPVYFNSPWDFFLKALTHQPDGWPSAEKSLSPTAHWPIQQVKSAKMDADGSSDWRRHGTHRIDSSHWPRQTVR